ncbi:methylated-DNA--[protein]-cysteine S-methyltransferase [Streptomyces sp. NP160]|uniref:methylated-DNA--[protein]-cysteine S-methyltransferase n=1 Tax=Streptomyces sp. NP160 TaxID=2586637 RepID=UPI00111AC98A|nr:methylated-DNA--[protein]-cysteine S-methyltransferase [Streptomyces sp. NP160]TNM67126.1 methylated-DNA--[protein]-cysteine S-methyltransferase [Streptomyces sp. NP160]
MASTPTRGLRHARTDSPLGPLVVVVDDDGALAGLYYADGHTPAPRPAALGSCADPDDPQVADVTTAVLARLEGASDVLEVPLSWAAVPGATDLQRAVWAQVAAIPRGETRTYGEVAAAIGRPTAVRAVGQAVGRNPHSLVVPCHRVVGSGGKITGYAGGVDVKRRLLELEGVALAAGTPVSDAPGAPAPGAPPSAP